MNVLFILGAGASVDSGLPTYRGKGGVYEKVGDPSQELSIGAWIRNPQRVWDILIPLVKKAREVKPGPTYQKIEELAKTHNVYIYTQNVDGLAKKVCDKVWEMHGNLGTMRCEKCNLSYDLDPYALTCDQCLSLCKPNIVLFNEGITQNFFTEKHFKYVIVMGTTLQFPYLTVLKKKYKQKGAKVIHINPDPFYSTTIGLPKNEEWLETTCTEGLDMVFKET